MVIIVTCTSDFDVTCCCIGQEVTLNFGCILGGSSPTILYSLTFGTLGITLGLF